MVRKGILNAQLKSALARAGHKKYIAIVDSGFGLPEGVECIDLAFLPNLPNILQVLEGVLGEFYAERILVSERIREWAPGFLSELSKIAEDVPLHFLSPDQFMEEMKQSLAIVRTGDYGTHGGNLIVVSGCTY